MGHKTYTHSFALLFVVLAYSGQVLKAPATSPLLDSLGQEIRRACSRTEVKYPALASEVDLTKVIIRLQRTECLGVCPAYSVTVFGDGTVVFE